MIIGDKVIVNDERGTVINIRFDDRTEPIYTIQLENTEATPDGLYYARREELRWGWY